METGCVADLHHNSQLASILCVATKVELELSRWRTPAENLPLSLNFSDEQSMIDQLTLGSLVFLYLVHLVERSGLRYKKYFIGLIWQSAVILVCVAIALRISRLQHATIGPRDADAGLRSSSRHHITLNLLILCLLGGRITVAHYTQTALTMLAPPPFERQYKSITQDRRLVKVYRISYPAFRWLNALPKLGRWFSARIPLRMRRTLANNKIKMLALQAMALLPLLRHHLMGLNDLRWLGMLGLLVNILRLLGIDFLWSLFYHDALEADGRFYHLRKPHWYSGLEVRSQPDENDKHSNGEYKSPEELSIWKYHTDRRLLGYTFYSRLEIEAKAQHLKEVIPGYDLIVYNCEGFVHNLFRRIVDHEQFAGGNKPPHRRLMGYQIQRGNALFAIILLVVMIFANIHPIFEGPTFGLLMILYFVQNWFFMSCTWHGMVPNNLVAVVHFLACFALAKTIGTPKILHELPFIDVVRIISGERFDMGSHVVAPSLLLMLSNLIVGYCKFKISKRYFDDGLPRVHFWHKETAHEGEFITIECFVPCNDEPVSQYKVTYDGVIPILSHLPQTTPATATNNK